MPYDYDPEDKFGYKDTLPENHPEKVITGVEFDDEFKKIETAINTLENVALGDGQFIDAPADNQLYGRKNLDWEVVPDPSGFLTDAPSDNKQYARKNSAWSVVQASGDAGAGLVISENEPADKVTGMQWLEADTGMVWIWDDGKWLQFPAGSSSSGSDPIAWDDVEGKPTEFAPSDHTHEIGEVNGFSTHKHEISDVNGLSTELSWKVGIEDQNWRFFDSYVPQDSQSKWFQERYPEMFKDVWVVAEYDPWKDDKISVGRVKAHTLGEEGLSDYYGHSVKLAANLTGDTAFIECNGQAFIRHNLSVENTVFGGINIVGADEERPDELPYSPNEKSIQYALTVSHETLGRTVEIDKEGIVRANDFADIDGNSLIWKGTQSEYNALTPNNNTLYFIV